MIRRYNELFVIPKLTYLGDATDSYSVKQFLQDYLSFLILFNYLIPISLYVTIELQRVIGSWFMEWDLELYENETDQPCVVNTSNLNEELGQINILFSDKTGTLTKNEMNFQQCSINGSKFLFKKTRLEDEETKALLDINKFSVSLFHRYSLSAVPKCLSFVLAGQSARLLPGLVHMPHRSGGLRISGTGGCGHCQTGASDGD